MKTDIEIAQEAKMRPITEIAAQLGLSDEHVIPYGRYKAKIDHRLIHDAKKQGKLILVTAISPTRRRGKTTTSVGLADAMNALGKKTMLCLREPSLGPVFGVKGGAAGGGIRTGGAHGGYQPALYRRPARHRHGQQPAGCHDRQQHPAGNPLNIDPRRITWSAAWT